MRSVMSIIMLLNKSILLIVLSLSFISCSNKTSFAIENFEEIPYAKLSDFMINFETSAEYNNLEALKVAILHNKTSNRFLLASYINKVLSEKNTTLLPLTHSFMPHIIVDYAKRPYRMTISFLAKDKRVAPNDITPPARFIDYDYSFINQHWILQEYGDATHSTKNPQNSYINHQKWLDFKNNKVMFSIGNETKKETFMSTKNIGLIESLGYELLLDKTNEQFSLSLKKFDFR